MVPVVERDIIRNVKMHCLVVIIWKYLIYGIGPSPRPHFFDFGISKKDYEFLESLGVFVLALQSPI